MSKNTTKIVELSKQKTEEAKNKVQNVLHELVENGERITFYKVFKKAGVSKSFVYQNEDIRSLIETYRENPVKVSQSENSKDVIILALRERIKYLEKNISQMSRGDKWKDKYEEILLENKELKKQLEAAYSQIYTS